MYAHDVSPGPALECLSCGTTSNVSEAERVVEECPECGEPATPIDVVRCGDDECLDEQHDFGTGYHHVAVPA